MPLNSAGLKTDLQSLFSAPPPDAAGCAAKWASTMQAYASGVVPPSTTVAAAAATFQTAMAAAFLSGPATVASVEAAFTGFAATVGAGMAPTFVGAPPPAPVGFALEFAKPPAAWAATHEAAATLWAARIHAWMITGKATLAVPPNTQTPWS